MQCKGLVMISDTFAIMIQPGTEGSHRSIMNKCGLRNYWPQPCLQGMKVLLKITGSSRSRRATLEPPYELEIIIQGCTQTVLSTSQGCALRDNTNRNHRSNFNAHKTQTGATESTGTRYNRHGGARPECLSNHRLWLLVT